MKRIYLSLLVIVTAVVVVAGTAWANWSASKILGTETSAATVSIDVLEGSGASMSIIPSVANLVPNSWGPDQTMYLRNTSSVPAKMYLYVTDLAGTGSCGITKLYISVNNGAEQKVVFNDVISNLVGADKKIEVTGANTDFNPTVGPGEQIVAHQFVGLADTNDNGYIGTTCNWNQVFVVETQP